VVPLSVASVWTVAPEATSLEHKEQEQQTKQGAAASDFCSLQEFTIVHKEV
jgi:hypothetical protein